MSQGDTYPLGKRLFDRLPPHVRPRDLVWLRNGQRAVVDTAKVADDLKDAKCTVVIVCPVCGCSSPCHKYGPSCP